MGSWDRPSSRVVAEKQHARREKELRLKIERIIRRAALDLADRWDAEAADEGGAEQAIPERCADQLRGVIAQASA